MRIAKRVAKFVFAGCALHALSSSIAVGSSSQLPIRVEEWRALYPELAAEDPLSVRAHRIFERLVRAADLRDRALPSLLLLEIGVPNAFALPGGAIVVSRSMLTHCFGEDSTQRRREAGDVRLALVLAHELAHLTFDSGHRAYFATLELGGRRAAKVLSASESDTHLRLEEREAEYFGLQFVLRAGFDRQHLLLTGKDFWQGLVEASHRAGVRVQWQHHPKPEERAELLHAQLAGLESAAPLLHWGRRFLEVGRHELASRLLEEYKLLFALPEVVRDIGRVHLQRAASELDRCGIGLQGDFFLPLSAVRARPEIRSPVANCQPSPRFRTEIELAKRALERVARVRSGDESALTYLAYAHLLEGDAAAAFSAINEAIIRAPSDPLAGVLWSITWFLLGREHGIDHSTGALEMLRSLREREAPTSHLARYNEARLLELVARPDEAMAVWTEAAVSLRGDAFFDLIWSSTSPRQRCIELEDPASVGLPEIRYSEHWRLITQRRIGGEHFRFYEGPNGELAAVKDQQTLGLEWRLSADIRDRVMQSCAPSSIFTKSGGGVVLSHSRSAIELAAGGAARAFVWSSAAEID